MCDGQKEAFKEENEDSNMKYYSTYAEAEANRRKGGRIYYRKGKGYYIRYPKRKNWWGL